MDKNMDYVVCDFDAEVALSELIDQVMIPAGRSESHAQTLPPRCYVDPAFYSLEVERILIPGWIAVAHVSQLEGREVLLPLLGELLVIHRGSSGVTVSTRAVDGTSRPVRNTVVDGLVYANLSGDAPPLAPQIAPLSERLAKIRMDELVVGMELTYDSTFNWKILVETFMECYHHIAAHTGTFEPLFPGRLSKIETGHSAWTSGFSVAHDDVADEQVAIGLPPLSDDLTPFERRAFYLYLIYPTTLLAVWPDRVYWFRTQPQGPASTALQTFELVRPEAMAPEYAAILATECAFLDQINREDIAVNEVQQLGASSRVARPGRLSHLETTIWHLADFVRSSIGPDMPR